MKKIFFIVFIVVCYHTNSWAQQTTTELEPMSITPNSSNCRPKRAFGLDIGFGSMSTSIHNGYKHDKDEAALTYAVGFRCLSILFLSIFWSGFLQI